jgi:hypothetical protein
MSEVDFEDGQFTDVFRTWLMAQEIDDRAPVIRSGERDPISPTVRFLIHMRDNWICRWCGFIQDPARPSQHIYLQADHIVPWSAGGSDRSDNLRSLCNLCNERRSNHITDMDHARARPVVAACDPCRGIVAASIHDPSYFNHLPPWQLREYLPGREQLLTEVGEFDLEPPTDPFHVYCYYGRHIGWVAVESSLL